jgi:hypothetical protein
MNIFVQNRFFPKVDDKTYICNKLFFITKNVLLLKNHRVNSNDLSKKSHEFKQLEQAILQHRIVQFEYKGKIYRTEPYKNAVKNNFSI